MWFLLPTDLVGIVAKGIEIRHGFTLIPTAQVDTGFNMNNEPSTSHHSPLFPFSCWFSGVFVVYCLMAETALSEPVN